MIISIHLPNTANMKRTYASNRTNKDERTEYIGLAIVVAGLAVMALCFLFATVWK